ncbi:hypothetical protein TSUD_34020 [Trifolium subterraneum]|uniref:Malectin-like domain-containing protein n=1 Tax=Trifolium subterraneum TaxID=3900 RepID=A0A2Z6MG07_TRISU|nr:hypothetical protein TSUD_34020 [Trifolium subterraneum]
MCIPILLNAQSNKDESLILGCGLDEKGGKDSDGRQWNSDNKYVSGGNSVTAKASFQDPSLLSEVPYMTARIFTSETTYKLPILPDKRYWLRLHFYPSVYNNFNPADSYFSVTANGVTLLNNFSSFITCQALSQAYIDREYALAPLNSDVLELKFKPSDKQDGAFAFVNGIQLIQMPDLLFDSPPLVGYPGQTVDAKADVIGWTGSQGVATYKDYVVYVHEEPGADQLWLALHPNPATTPRYYDSMLNGVEIFKLNDTNLSGPNPQLSDMMMEYEERFRNFEDKNGHRKNFAIGGAAGGAAGFALVAAICIAVHQRKKRTPGSYTNTTSSWLPLYGNSHTGTKSTSGKTHYKNLSLGSEHDPSHDSTGNSAAIFSQIGNPKGR